MLVPVFVVMLVAPVAVVGPAPVVLALVEA
jgi:hypothetical protein